jgi:hypothetical protein
MPTLRHRLFTHVRALVRERERAAESMFAEAAGHHDVADRDALLRVAAAHQAAATAYVSALQEISPEDAS